MTAGPVVDQLPQVRFGLSDHGYVVPPVGSLQVNADWKLGRFDVIESHRGNSVLDPAPSLLALGSLFLATLPNDRPLATTPIGPGPTKAHPRPQRVPVACRW